MSKASLFLSGFFSIKLAATTAAEYVDVEMLTCWLDSIQEFLESIQTEKQSNFFC